MAIDADGAGGRRGDLDVARTGPDIQLLRCAEGDPGDLDILPARDGFDGVFGFLESCAEGLAIELDCRNLVARVHEALDFDQGAGLFAPVACAKGGKIRGGGAQGFGDDEGGVAVGALDRGRAAALVVLRRAAFGTGERLGHGSTLVRTNFKINYDNHFGSISPDFEC